MYPLSFFDEYGIIKQIQKVCCAVRSCFRKETKEEFDRINQLFMEILRVIYERDDVKSHQDGDLEDCFFSGEDWICVAEINGQEEGFLSMEVHREQENSLCLDDFSVRRNYRSKGLENALMDEAEQSCRCLGFSNIYLHVEESNLKARSV